VVWGDEEGDDGEDEADEDEDDDTEGDGDADLLGDGEGDGDADLLGEGEGDGDADLLGDGDADVDADAASDTGADELRGMGGGTDGVRNEDEDGPCSTDGVTRPECPEGTWPAGEEPERAAGDELTIIGA